MHPFHLWQPSVRAWCSDVNDLTVETLEKQYELVKRRTSNNGTYNQGSHVLQFGTLTIDEEPAADYLGSLNTGAQPECTPTPTPLIVQLLRFVDTTAHGLIMCTLPCRRLGFVRK